MLFRSRRAGVRVHIPQVDAGHFFAHLAGVQIMGVQDEKDAGHLGLEPYSGITAISRLTLVEESIFCTVFSGDLLQWHGLKYSIRLFPG